MSHTFKPFGGASSLLKPGTQTLITVAATHYNLAETDASSRAQKCMTKQKGQEFMKVILILPVMNKTCTL